MIQVAPNVYQIGLGGVNVFVIEDDGLTLVDCGYPGSTDKIFAALENAGKSPGDVRRLILTHSHPDHAGSAAEIQRRLHIPVLAHTADAQLLAQGIAGRLPHHRSPGFVNWLVFNIFSKRVSNVLEPVEAEELLTDGQVLPIAGGLRVIHTPGHSAGHIALLAQRAGGLIAGDLCANMAGLDLSTVYEDRALGVASIAKAAAFDFSTAVFGHGGPLRPAANQKLRARFGASTTAVA